ncbi:hypothetical protein HYH02_012458 [Chlamydomonas schloesseri]|uniref:Uncharacterized protein n=1 Tax=Chlamydomonas schloesseri TaxID=2026947 RepID=A0A835SYV9_9CHLO|nr:hypothetical protein HYH02_012458 [Chlamydomonas schloesseri]|eukprot:KAG2433997.1 hypothetical protein HYH02_012458 [Chlamydomonas schloesseri]
MPSSQGLCMSSAPALAARSKQTQGHSFKNAPKAEEHRECAAAIIFSPKQTYDHIVATGVAKTTLPLSKQVTQGVLAGFYISFSFMLCMTVGGQITTIQRDYPGLYNFILGSVGFPLGLTVIMVVGADLFTSSCMYMMTAWIEGRVATYYVLKNWFLAWWCNLAGCLIMAQLVVWAQLFHGKESFPIFLANKKTSYPFGATVVKGIICNWLVNLAVWMANSARDVTGKAVGVYLPVSAFVTLGTEHVIANQFELSLAKMLGSGMSLKTIIGSNWVPATIGNIIGGAFFVGTLYAGVYGTLYERMWLRCLQAYVFLLPRSVRERIHATRNAVYEKLFGWIDWDYITTAPADVISETAGQDLNEDSPGPHDLRHHQQHQQLAKASGADAANGPLDRKTGASTTGGGANSQRGGGSVSRAATSGLRGSGPGRAISSLLAEAVRNPPLTPFERQRTEAALGSDVV